MFITLFAMAYIFFYAKSIKRLRRQQQQQVVFYARGSDEISSFNWMLNKLLLLNCETSSDKYGRRVKISQRLPGFLRPAKSRLKF